jgi:hypothetical protein
MRFRSPGKREAQIFALIVIFLVAAVFAFGIRSKACLYHPTSPYHSSTGTTRLCFERHQSLVTLLATLSGSPATQSPVLQAILLGLREGATNANLTFEVQRAAAPVRTAQVRPVALFFRPPPIAA